MSIVEPCNAEDWNGTAWVPCVSQTRVSRPTPELFVGQNPPYDPTWAPEWVDCNLYNLSNTATRTIESFLTGVEVLHGDGVTDDSVIFNRCLDRAVAWAHTHDHFVLSLPRTYKCDDIIDVQNLDPLTWMRITGPGGTTRSPFVLAAPPYVGSSRIQAQWKFTNCKRFELVDFTINGWRRPANDGGRDNNYEAQHGVWLIGCDDVELRQMRITNVMGDFIALASTVGSPRIDATNIRIYSCTFINCGRHACTPLGRGLDFYDNYVERNSSHLFDVETSGSGELADITIRNNRFHNCNGSFFRMPAFPYVTPMTTVTEGSPIMTSSGTANNRFRIDEIGRLVTNGVAALPPAGDGIPANTTIISMQSQSQVTLSQPATGVTQATGYRRIYISLGTDLVGFYVIDNVRTSSTNRAATAIDLVCSGGTELDGSHTFTDVVVTGNMWNREHNTTFWKITNADRVLIAGNHGPWDSSATGPEAVVITSCTGFNALPLTSGGVRGANPDVFRCPI